MRQKGYSLYRRVGWLVTFLLIVVFSLYGYESYSRSYQIYLHETYDQLRTVSYQLEKELLDVMDELFEIEIDHTLTKSERIESANNLLQPIVNHITQDRNVIGLGYYSSNLEATLAIAPLEELSHLIGYELEPNHPAQELHRQGFGELTQITEIKRGNVVYYTRLIYEDGKVVGRIFVNLPIKPFYQVFYKSLPPFFKLFLLTLTIITFIVAYIYHEIKKSTNTLKCSIENYSTELSFPNVDDAVLNEKLPIEFRPLVQKYLLMQKRIQELIKELTVSARVAALGDMMAIITHDIRNPLAVISCSAEIGNKIGEPEKKNLYFQKIISSVDKMNEMLNYYLLLVRSPSEIKERIDIHKLLDELTVLTSTLAVQKGIEVICDAEADLPCIEGDSIALSQALINILKNAMDATPQGGKVTISASQKENKVKISVTDTGRGIPEELQNMIFERFFTTREEGTGIGLSMAQSVITKHGGSIRVTSTLGQGSTFYVQLPIAVGTAKK